MVVIDIEKELRRIKREQRAAELYCWRQTEKQMRSQWAADDAKMAKERAQRLLEWADEPNISEKTAKNYRKRAQRILNKYK